MDQTINVLHNLSKCAEGHELNDLDGCYIANSVLVGEHLPGIILALSVAERDLLLLCIQSDNEYFDSLADFQNVRGMTDSVPGQLGDVNHTVNTADINKCAVAGEGLDNALVLVADSDGLPDLCLSLTASLIAQLLDGTDYTATCAVDLGDADLVGCLHHSVKGSILGQAGLACGDEYSDAQNVSDYAALVLINDNAIQGLFALNSTLKLLPILNSIKATLGKSNNAVNVIYANNGSFDLIADFDALFELKGGIVGQLSKRNISSLLNAKVNSDVGIVDLRYYAAYLFSCM